MPVHRKVCTAEKPFKPMPNAGSSGGGNMGSSSINNMSQSSVGTKPSGGVKEVKSQAYSSTSYGMKKRMSAPDIDEEEENFDYASENMNVPMKSNVKAQQMKGK